MLINILASQNTIDDLVVEREPLESKMIKLEAEVGPVKYIAALAVDWGVTTEVNTSEAVRWVILIIILVFDPLAVLLLVAANQSLLRRFPVKPLPPEEVLDLEKPDDEGIDLKWNEMFNKNDASQKMDQATEQLKEWKQKLDAFNSKVPKPDAEAPVEIIQQEDESIPHIDLKGQKKTEDKEIVVDNTIDGFDPDEVEGFEEFNKKYETPEVDKEKQLDVLMLNAGLMATPQGETTEGYELQMGVNVLGHALLADLLLPLIKNTPKARVVTLSSVAGNSGRPLQKEMFSLSENYRPWRVYYNSKLGNLHYAKALAKYFEEEKIDAISVAAHPGGTASELQINTRNMGGVGLSGTFWVYSMKFFGMNIHQGALSQLMGALSDEVKNGDYIGPKGSGSAFKGDPKVIKKTTVSESDIDNFRSLVKAELGLKHF